MLGHPVDVVSAGPLPAGREPLPVADPVSSGYAEVLAEVLQRDSVPADAHLFDDLGADSMVMARFCARVRKREGLPPVAIKDVYQHPTIRALAEALAPAPTAGPVQQGLAEVLAEVLQRDSVPADAHLFDDLGADSMVMARFCARVRKREGLPPVSIKDVYQHPTIRTLAEALAPAPTAGATPTAGDAAPTAVGPLPEAGEPVRPVHRAGYVLCGALQLTIFVGYAHLAAIVLTHVYGWISAGSGLVDVYLRSAVAGTASFVGLCTAPILVKWLLIGRWTPRRIRIWSLDYVRFWFVRTLVQANPLVLFFAGSPLYVLYLRALGARIGPGVVILSRRVPVCTDLFTVGAGTVVRKLAIIPCYNATAGWLRTGPVTLGRDVVVGETTVLDIGTSMGDGAQLGHASSLHAGQFVPAGEHWAGSPAQRVQTDFSGVDAAPCGTRRRVTYSMVQLLILATVSLPLAYGGVSMVLVRVPWLAALLDPGPLALTSPSYYGVVLVSSLAVFAGVLVLRMLVVVTVPRLLRFAVRPGRVHPLYGFAYACHRAISRSSNNRYLTALFGDSSFIVAYLRAVGYRLTPLVQTGSNFGTKVDHDDPFLVSVGRGTVCASELTLVNAHYSSTSFRVSRARIGAGNFLGNLITYPAGSRTGDDVLLATKVMVPIDGEIRQGVGLLGSPAFEIPRTVERDSRFAAMATEEEIRRRLPAKNRHNLVTICLTLTAQWFLYLVLLLVAFTAADLYASWGSAAMTAATVVALVFSILYTSFVERAVTGFRGVRPTHCSIYDIQFWRVERFFKNTAEAHAVLNGTPFKGPALRLLGMRVGRRLFDDGAGWAEKNMVTVGDDVTLNVGCNVQCHSQEDYAFKSDRITIGSGCTVGAGSLVHYGVTMGDGAVLAPDSFLMKGEEIPPHAYWGGNPARELARRPFLPAAPIPDSLDARTATVADPLTRFPAGDDALPALPRPRRGGRHRASRRHLAGSR